MNCTLLRVTLTMALKTVKNIIQKQGQVKKV